MPREPIAQAIEDLQEAAEINPKSSEAHYQVGPGLQNVWVKKKKIRTRAESSTKEATEKPGPHFEQQATAEDPQFPDILKVSPAGLNSAMNRRPRLS